jgi:hypothetical protein
MHGEVDPNAPWTQNDTKLHNQRLLVAGRFVHFVCTTFNIAVPTLPDEADRVLVNAVGNSGVFAQFTQAVVASGAAASTEANHAQALVHASNYAKEQLSNKASTADEGALVSTVFAFSSIYKLPVAHFAFKLTVNLTTSIAVTHYLTGSSIDVYDHVIWLGVNRAE